MSHTLVFARINELVSMPILSAGDIVEIVAEEFAGATICPTWALATAKRQIDEWAFSVEMDRRHYEDDYDYGFERWLEKRAEQREYEIAEWMRTPWGVEGMGASL